MRRKQASADVQETALAELDKNILLILLKDRSTGKNILWATDDYKDLGIGFAADDEITLPAITGAHGNLIKPRALKSKEEQGARTRNMAEVFTPLWICNKQNNLADNAWFGRENAFNTETGLIGRQLRAKLPFQVKMAQMAGELTLPASAWKLPAVKRRILLAVTTP